MSSTDLEEATMPKVTVPFHHHPLSSYTFEVWEDCCLCYWTRLITTPIGHRCTDCGMKFHEECVDSLFITRPYMCNHILKIFSGSFTSSDSINDNSCHFCQRKLTYAFFFVRCTICNINVDSKCIIASPPLTISEPKHHKHSLTLLLRLVTFTCNACGVESDRNPYVCLECNLMVHGDCIENLPRVISINRHDHRISHTFHLGQGEGDWECGVCRKTINWVYGAYKCSRCPRYAVHSKCATRKEVWDGLELEDVPEEDEEIEDPFKVINGKGDIIHFSHEEHVLRLVEKYVTDDAKMRCRCCILAINGDRCYRCVDCDFILHETCANLPRKKRHLLHKHKLTLSSTRNDENLYALCTTCGIHTDGHHGDCKRYNIKYDVRCSSVSEPFHHELHQHPLYFTLQSSRRCQACNTKIVKDPLNCLVCDEYSLCMRCATLPRKVKHRCDDHSLSLCQGVGNASGELWCDICETKTDPSVRYYTCDECGTSLHIDCVLGDLYYMRRYHPQIEIHPNNGATRPLCTRCGFRCKFPFFLRYANVQPDFWVCSLKC